MGNKWGGGEGENFRFAGRANSHAREGWRGARNSTRFFTIPPSPTSAISRGTRWKNGARIRITRQTTAQLKLRSRDQRKRNAATKKRRGKRREKTAKREFRVPSFPPFYGHLGARVEKFLLCGNHLLPAARERVTPLRLFFRRNAHTPLQTTHFPNTSRAYIRTKSKRKREREGEEEEWIGVGRFSTGREAAKQPASQPASRLADQPTIPHSIRRFSLSLPGT